VPDEQGPKKGETWEKMSPFAGGVRAGDKGAARAMKPTSEPTAGLNDVRAEAGGRNMISSGRNGVT